MASQSTYIDSTPETVKDADGIVLLSFSTPNGKVPQILVEELSDAYGFTFAHLPINLFKGEHKADWYLRINPNNKIPALIDNSKSPPFTIIETAAQILYLLELVDKDNKFGFSDPVENSEMLQWISFWHGNAGPMLSNLTFFGKFREEKIPEAIERFKEESLRNLGVVEDHLSGKHTGQPRDYLAGNGKGKYSGADIKVWPWVTSFRFTEQIDEKDMQAFPHLMKWAERIAERPAVKRAVGEKYDSK